MKSQEEKNDPLYRYYLMSTPVFYHFSPNGSLWPSHQFRWFHVPDCCFSACSWILRTGIKSVSNCAIMVCTVVVTIILYWFTLDTCGIMYMLHWPITLVKLACTHTLDGFVQIDSNINTV